MQPAPITPEDLAFCSVVFLITGIVLGAVGWEFFLHVRDQIRVNRLRRLQKQTFIPRHRI